MSEEEEEGFQIQKNEDNKTSELKPTNGHLHNAWNMSSESSRLQSSLFVYDIIVTFS